MEEEIYLGVVQEVPISILPLLTPSMDFQILYLLITTK